MKKMVENDEPFILQFCKKNLHFVLVFLEKNCAFFHLVLVLLEIVFVFFLHFALVLLQIVFVIFLHFVLVLLRKKGCRAAASVCHQLCRFFCFSSKQFPIFLVLHLFLCSLFFFLIFPSSRRQGLRVYAMMILSPLRDVIPSSDFGQSEDRYPAPRTLRSDIQSPLPPSQQPQLSLFFNY